VLGKALRDGYREKVTIATKMPMEYVHNREEMQALLDSELKKLGRIHTYDEFEKTYNDARLVGFDNINIDVMYGIPNQTAESFTRTLNKVIELEPEHVSLYALSLEEGTPMFKMKDKLKFPSDEEQFEMYCEAIRRLKKVGLAPYEVSNFAIRDKESMHNIKYWMRQEYIGLGVAAHSFFKGERFEATKNIRTYVYAMELVKKKIPIFVSYEKIGREEGAKEFFTLGMRLYEGIERKEFEEKFGDELAAMYLDPLADYVEDGYVKIEKGVYSFTEKGMFVSNYILSDIFEMVDEENAELGYGGNENDAEDTSDAEDYDED